MEKAVIYARYSSHNQREESIDGQLRKCREFAAKHDLAVIEEYIDRAISGKTDNRADFQRMIRDAEKRQFSVIIMYTLDRFARNRYDSAIYKAKLKKCGVKIYYTEQSITDEPEGIILESLLEGMAEYYSENLSRGVRRGMKENALKCMITGGTMPLGYRRSAEQKYEIDPKTAPIVREIFDLYSSGYTQRMVVDELNSKGYRTARGERFRIGSLSTILTNKKYIGIYTFDDVEIEDGMPAIITKEQFDDVQEKLKLNKRTSGRMKAPAPYLLTSKLYCGKCGSPMIGESGTSHTGNVYNYYKCSQRKKHKTCDKKNEKKEWLEKIVVEETVRQILRTDAVTDIARRVADLANREFNDKSRLNFLCDELNATQTAINNLLRLVEQGVQVGDVGKRLTDLDEQRTELQKQISIEKIKKPALTEEQIASWLTSFVGGGDPNDVAFQQRVIDALVNRVYVFDTDGGDGGKKIVVMYNTSKNNTSTVTLSDLSTILNGSDFDGNFPPKKPSRNSTWLFSIKSVVAEEIILLRMKLLCNKIRLCRDKKADLISSEAACRKFHCGNAIISLTV